LKLRVKVIYTPAGDPGASKTAKVKLSKWAAAYREVMTDR
jgi:hypothetical protein